MHGYSRNLAAHWFKLFQQSASLVISSDPQSVAGEKESPFTQRACFRRSCMQSMGWCGGCSQRCVILISKESACCFTAEAPQGIRTSGRQGLYLFLCQLVFLPSSWHPPRRPPPFPSSWPPHKSYCIWVSHHHCFQPPPSFFYLNQNQFSLVSGPKSLSVIYQVCVPSQSACLHPEWPHMKADHVGPDVLPPTSKARTQLSGRLLLLLPLPSCPSKRITKWTPNVCSSFKWQPVPC